MRRREPRLVERIGAALPAAMVALRTRLLVVDVMAKYSCSRSTAKQAVAMARVRVGIERRHGR